MLEIKFYKINEIPIENVMYVVIMARYNNKWIIVRNKDRKTWEIPGGHVEINEKLDNAAKRELYEETGTVKAELKIICRYIINDGVNNSYGQLYFAEVNHIAELPKFEIEEIKFVENLPNNLTYPLIQPYIFEKVIEYLKKDIS